MRIICFVLTLFASMAAAQQPAARRDVQQILSTRVSRYSLKAANLLQAVGEIASDFDLPMGIEWQGDPSSGQEINRVWTDATVERILSDVAASDVEYRLQVSNNVVHLRNGVLTEASANPLNIRVPSFSAANEYSRMAALKLKEQVNLMLSQRPQQGAAAYAGSYGAGADETLVTISMTDTSVRDILDAILVRSHSAMWLVTFPTGTPASASGLLRTKSILRNQSPSAELDWDFLSRYTDPATGRYRGDWKIKFSELGGEGVIR